MGSRVQCLQLQVDFARFVALQRVFCKCSLAYILLQNPYYKKIYEPIALHIELDKSNKCLHLELLVIFTIFVLHIRICTFILQLGGCNIQYYTTCVTKLVFQIHCCSKLLCEHPSIHRRSLHAYVRTRS